MQRILALALLLSLPPAAFAAPQPLLFHRQDIAFELRGLQGNPFDIVENDVMVRLKRPDGAIQRLPAFYDTPFWRVRYTPSARGRYAVLGVTRNGKAIRAEAIKPTAFWVSGKTAPGFVRRDARDPRRFVLESGGGYYPIGHNAAWEDQKTYTVSGVLGKMGAAGMNWSRIWMCHWDLKNLDWVENTPNPIGAIHLGAARRWDAIVRAAEKSGVRFQMVLQHHGQFSSGADANWEGNPWNVANGGFLASAAEFFTNARARALTKSKYRYVIARWGYSPSIMAWELFNEVQWTDAVRNGRKADVAAWHNEMADFIRKQDPYRHLITSSMSIVPDTLGTRLDYWQPHAYVADPLPAVTNANRLRLDRPLFLGEIGPEGSTGPESEFIHRLLWSSMMTESAGAAQYWSWEVVNRENWYSLFRPAATFVMRSGLADQRALKAITPEIQSDARGPLTFSPGGGWEKAKQTEFTVLPSGEVPGLGGMPRYLQGAANKALFPSLTLQVSYREPGAFAVRISQVARLGSRVVLSLDGREVAVRDFPAAESDTNVDATMETPVPAGRHSVRLEATGADWVVLSRFTLDPYASRLGALGKANADYAVLWVYDRSATSSPVSGRLRVTSLSDRAYSVQWWDTRQGKPLSTVRARADHSGALTLTTPSVYGDVAAVVRSAP